MRIAMIGTGYVGLVSGACFADFGHQVTCVDKDGAKIASLRRGEIPIFEPGLDALVASNVKAGRLDFTTDLKGPVAEAILYVNEHVGQIAAVGNDGFGGIGALAGWVLAHIDLGGSRRSTSELNRSIHGCYRVRIDRSSRSGGCTRSGRLFFRRIRGLFFLLATGCQEQQREEGESENYDPVLSVHNVEHLSGIWKTFR